MLQLQNGFVRRSKWHLLLVYLERMADRAAKRHETKT